MLQSNDRRKPKSCNAIDFIHALHARHQRADEENVADLVWKSAELLTGAFKPAEYRKVVLPLFVLRRLDCLLEPTKDAVLAKYKGDKSQELRSEDVYGNVLRGTRSGTSTHFTMKKLLEAPDGVRDNLEDMINGFSPNVRRVFEKFGFMQTVDKLQEKRRLYLVVQNFANTAMDLKSLSGHDMGVAFEELLRKFNDVAPADEQYTPRDVIHLMVNILFDGEDEALSVPGVIRTMYDPASGTGGMLSEGEEKFRTFNSSARLRLFGRNSRTDLRRLHVGHADSRAGSGQHRPWRHARG